VSPLIVGTAVDAILIKKPQHTTQSAMIICMLKCLIYIS